MKLLETQIQFIRAVRAVEGEWPVVIGVPYYNRDLPHLSLVDMTWTSIAIGAPTPDSFPIVTVRVDEFVNLPTGRWAYQTADGTVKFMEYPRTKVLPP